MSLTFQSGESIKQALFEELQNILNPNTEVRVAAEGRMKQLEYTEGCGSQTQLLSAVFIGSSIFRLWCLSIRNDNESIVRLGITAIIVSDVDTLR